MTISPHGNLLINRFNPHLNLEGIHQQIEIDDFAIANLDCIANGAFSPLEGFMCRKDYENVLHNMRLETGLVWPIPITLSISEEKSKALKIGSTVKLVNKSETYGVIEVNEIYAIDKRLEASKVYGTTDNNHPGVERIYQQSGINIGGKVTMVKHPRRIVDEKYHLNPIATRAEFKKRGWENIVGFQTRNPIHRAHEYIQKAALETMDGLFLHPLVGETKKDDIPQQIRMKSYETILKYYYPEKYTVLAAFPAPMYYAGPREAVFHALVRKNYGCTHFVVGRDHAGVGDYYGTYDSQLIFKDFKKDEIEIVPLFFEHSFYCKKCKAMASLKTCPHDKSDHLILSGTKVREMLKNGQRPPKEFSRPEVIDILLEGLKEKQTEFLKGENVKWHNTIVTKEERQKLLGQKSCVLWFTGLSGAGKSTLANEVEKKLNALGISSYLLDGDNIRLGLNKDLSFTEEDRNENIRRIGEVAKLFVDSGIIVLTAFISPYIENRRMVRELLEETEFVEIYIKCSVEACEKRDTKGLYKKARKGEIENFTGISSPYQAPTNPEITVDTENMPVEECTEKIIGYLLENGYLDH